MNLLDYIPFLSRFDLFAVAFLFASWLLVGWRIEHPSTKAPSVSVIMADYRREWMRQMVTREPRIFDATILGNLRQGTAFFASASLIATGGVLALFSNKDELIGLAGDLTLDLEPAIVWDIKLIVMLFFVTNAFLKFVWSNRLFGYCAVLMSSVPNDPNDPVAYPRAAKAAEINITAARGFNRGLRSVYFALASGAWLAGPIPLAIATTVTCLVLWRREFASVSRSVLLMRDDAGA
jgi:uncharacterized membrane protein